MTDNARFINFVEDELILSFVDYHQCKGCKRKGKQREDIHHRKDCMVVELAEQNGVVLNTLGNLPENWYVGLNPEGTHWVALHSYFTNMVVLVSAKDVACEDDAWDFVSRFLEQVQ